MLGSVFLWQCGGWPGWTLVHCSSLGLETRGLSRWTEEKWLITVSRLGLNFYKVWIKY